MTGVATHGPEPRQPMNTFFAQNVPPFENSSIVLSGGRTQPYYYSLGNQSTVPFVKLQGSGGTQKQFTWGETIEVLPNQNVTVQSASYMIGDIQIHSGRDVANCPARITTPIDTNLHYFPLRRWPVGAQIKPLYPCDTRRARRAYLGGFFQTGNAFPCHITIIGQNKQHSWPSEANPNFVGPFGDGKIYMSEIFLPANTDGAMIPLGYGAYLENPVIPHNLPDMVTFVIDPTEGGGGGAPSDNHIIPPFFYVVEYL